MVSRDRIRLTLPGKAEYVSVIRLAASGIASRVGFDIETVEDIKVAVSEVCNRIISVMGGRSGCYEATFEILENGIRILFMSDLVRPDCLFEEDDELGKCIVSAFMDEVDFCSESNYLLSMSKKIGEISNNEL